MEFRQILFVALKELRDRLRNRWVLAVTVVFTVFALVMLPVIPFVWSPPADWMIALMLMMTGILGSTGHYFLIAGHKLAPASVLAPYVYTQLIWVIIFGYLVFGQVPNNWTIAGAAIVIASGLYLLNRERKMGRSVASEAAVEGPRE